MIASLAIRRLAAPKWCDSMRTSTTSRSSGTEMGFHLLRRAGYDEHLVSEVARVMEYSAAYSPYRDDVEYFEG